MFPHCSWPFFSICPSFILFALTQVAQNGFASLSEAQQEELEGVTCNVIREQPGLYPQRFRRPRHGNMDFIRFCEAQLVWNTAMAIKRR